MSTMIPSVRRRFSSTIGSQRTHLFSSAAQYSVMRWSHQVAGFLSRYPVKPTRDRDGIP